MSSNEQALRGAFKHMNADVAQDIREAYYKAADGLAALVELLGPANVEALVAECKIAKAALKAFDKSELGKVL